MTDVHGLSIGDYLVKRLQDYGLEDMFGIPGDYVLSLYGKLEKSPINVIGCTREDCAGFAADAYARVNGMGAVCVTYCVGGSDQFGIQVNSFPVMLPGPSVISSVIESPSGSFALM